MIDGHNIEPHAPLLITPHAGQRLFKVMRADHFIEGVRAGHLHFTRVDAYQDFPNGDSNDGAPPPLDHELNKSIRFQGAPEFRLSDYYAKSRRRTYACCFSLESTNFIWRNYGQGCSIGQVGIEFIFDKLRAALNAQLSQDSVIMCDNLPCRQIFSINYGLIQYLDWNNHCANRENAINPIIYSYMKDSSYSPERELRVTLTALGIGTFELDNGCQFEFPPAIKLIFNYRKAFADGTIPRIHFSADTKRDEIASELGKLGIKVSL